MKPGRVTVEPRRGYANAGLRVFSTEVPTRWITERLGVAPDEAGDVGSRRTPDRPARKRTAWFLHSRLERNRPLGEHIDCLLKRIPASMTAFHDVAACSQLDIFAGYFAEHGQGGESLPWQVLQRLADRRIALSIDLYPPTPDGGFLRFLFPWGNPFDRS